MKPVLIAVAVLAAAVGAGLAARVASEMPQRVAVDDGSILRLHVEGRRGPVVVLEMETDEALRARLAQFARIVDYQRGGWGDSEIAGTKRDADQIAKELHTALANAHLAAPYILVGDTMGSVFVRRFAQKFPQDVAGLVLIDPLIEDAAPNEAVEWLKSNRPQTYTEFQGSFLEAANQAGPTIEWVRFVCASRRRKFEEILERALPAQRPAWIDIVKGRIQSEESSREIYSYITSYRGAERDEFIAFADTFKEVHGGGALPPVPTRVITGMRVSGTGNSDQASFERAEREYDYNQHERLLPKHASARHLTSTRAQRDLVKSDPDFLIGVLREFTAPATGAGP